MRVPSRPRQLGVSVNITPLIDVIFLLIIFFLAASHFVRNETRESVDLPEAMQGEDETKESSARLIVSVGKEGEYRVGGREASLEEIASMIFDGHAKDGEQFELRIRGDRNVPYRHIEPLMIESAKIGVSQLKFGVLPGEG